MKKSYVVPSMNVETFTANEYCASTCGKQPGGKYIFKCDAPDGVLYYYDKDGDLHKMGSYHDCGETHVTDGPGNYYDGFIDRNNNGKEDDGEYALIWRQYLGWPWGYDGHASASLSREEIDVERS